MNPIRATHPVLTDSQTIGQWGYARQFDRSASVAARMVLSLKTEKRWRFSDLNRGQPLLVGEITAMHNIEEGLLKR